MEINFIFCFKVKRCPGDGICSGKGTCDETRGFCDCLNGFVGESCQCMPFIKI